MERLDILGQVESHTTFLKANPEACLVFLLQSTAKRSMLSGVSMQKPRGILSVKLALYLSIYPALGR